MVNLLYERSRNVIFFLKYRNNLFFNPRVRNSVASAAMTTKVGDEVYNLQQ